jgi:hypothetical protein
MIFHEKYELLALRGGDHEIALPGREISSGRDVLVHLLAAGYTPENLELLAAIDKLPAEHQRRVLDRGDHEGIPYVITEVLAGTLKLREWLAAAKSEAPSPAPVKSSAQRGVWRVPAAVGAPPKSAAPASEPEEFRRLFEPVKEPEQVRRPPTQDELPTAQIVVPRLDQMAPATPVAMQAPAPAEPEPGEFTRIMRSPAAPPLVPPTAPPAAMQAPAPAEPEPGEFTRILRSAAAPPAPPAATPAVTRVPAPPAPEPGEFTRILRSTAPPEPPVATAAAPQAPAPAAPEPGEFTRMFQTEAPDAPRPSMSGADQFGIPAPPAPTQTPRSAGPGEFTRMMQSPLAPEPLRSRPAAAPPPSASEFDRMMQAGQFTEAPPPEVRLPDPAAPPPPAARPMQAPGEFTRMFATEPEPSESLAAPAEPQAPLPQGGAATGAFSRRSLSAPPPAPAGSSEFTQMFAARPPATPAETPAPAPAPPAPKAEKSYLPLILILGGLFLLVVIVVLIFALKS